MALVILKFSSLFHLLNYKSLLNEKQCEAIFELKLSDRRVS
jgi:hypothetical protein